MYFLKINIEDFCKVCITKERKRFNVIGYKLTSQVLDKTKGRLRSWLVSERFSELHSKMASTETEQQQMYFSEFHHPTMLLMRIDWIPLSLIFLSEERMIMFCSNKCQLSTQPAQKEITEGI